MDYEVVKNFIILFFLLVLGIILLNLNNKGNPFEKSIKIIASQIFFFFKKPKEHVLIVFPYFIAWLISSDFFYFSQIILLPLVFLTGIFLVVSTHRLIIIEDKNLFWFDSAKVKAYFSYLIYGFIFLILLIIPSFFLGFALQNFYLHEGIEFYLYILFLIGLFLLLSLIFSSYALNLPKAAIGDKVEFFKMYEASRGYKIIILVQFIIITFTYRIIEFIIPLLTNNIYVILILSSVIAALTYCLTISCISKTFLLMQNQDNQI